MFLHVVNCNEGVGVPVCTNTHASFDLFDPSRFAFYFCGCARGYTSVPVSRKKRVCEPNEDALSQLLLNQLPQVGFDELQVVSEGLQLEVCVLHSQYVFCALENGAHWTSHGVLYPKAIKPQSSSQPRMQMNSFVRACVRGRACVHACDQYACPMPLCVCVCVPRIRRNDQHHRCVFVRAKG